MKFPKTENEVEFSRFRCVPVPAAPASARFPKSVGPDIIVMDLAQDGSMQPLALPSARGMSARHRRHASDGEFSLQGISLPAVKLEVPININHEAVRPMSARLRQRMEQGAKPIEQLVAESARSSARGTALHQEHLEAVKARARKESERVIEAAARKHLLESEITRKQIEKLEAARLKIDTNQMVQQAKRDAVKAKRVQMALAAQAKRQMQGASTSREEKVNSELQTIREGAVMASPTSPRASGSVLFPADKDRMSPTSVVTEDLRARSFERKVFYSAPSPGAVRRSLYYEIKWGDGSRRVVRM